MLAAADAPLLGLHPLNGYLNHLLNQLGFVRIGILAVQCKVHQRIFLSIRK
jgi:hypothetical protein